MAAAIETAIIFMEGCEAKVVTAVHLQEHGIDRHLHHRPRQEVIRIIEIGIGQVAITITIVIAIQGINVSCCLIV